VFRTSVFCERFITFCFLVLA